MSVRQWRHYERALKRRYLILALQIPILAQLLLLSVDLNRTQLAEATGHHSREVEVFLEVVRILKG